MTRLPKRHGHQQRVHQAQLKKHVRFPEEDSKEQSDKDRRKESKNDSKIDSTNFPNPPEFSYFNNLPSELRLRIWYVAPKLRDNLDLKSPRSRSEMPNC
jgi:hypothetical protein